jgi:hypothetical protein
MNPKLQSYLVESYIACLSLCICPRDHFGPETYPLGKIGISLRDGKKRGLRNISGYFVFLNLEADTYSVRIETDYYFAKNFDVIIPSYSSPPGGFIPSDDEDVQLMDYKGVLVATVNLRPNPAYPFPGGSSLIRGIVYDAAANPVPDALVSVLGKPIANKTTKNGEFVLYFTELTGADIQKVNGRKFIKGNGSQEIRIQAEHPALGVSQPFPLQLEEGTTASGSIFYS